MSEPREVFPGVTVDPEVSFGRPTIKGTGIACAVIASRFLAGDNMSDLADDYRLTFGEIEAALRWHLLSPYKRKRKLA